MGAGSALFSGVSSKVNFRAPSTVDLRGRVKNGLSQKNSTFREEKQNFEYRYYIRWNLDEIENWRNKNLRAQFFLMVNLANFMLKNLCWMNNFPSLYEIREENDTEAKLCFTTLAPTKY